MLHSIDGRFLYSRLGMTSSFDLYIGGCDYDSTLVKLAHGDIEKLLGRK